MITKMFNKIKVNCIGFYTPEMNYKNNEYFYSISIIFKK
jgi:hypothetical protein